MEYKANDWKKYLHDGYVNYFKAENEPNLKYIPFDNLVMFFEDFFEIMKNGDEKSINNYQKVLIVCGIIEKVARKINFRIEKKSNERTKVYPYYEWVMPVKSNITITYRYNFSDFYLPDNFVV